MKIFISVDAEGISGIVDSAQVIPGMSNYEEGRRYITEDINACVRGCIDGGATEVIVADRHYQGRNVMWHELDENASYFVGRTEDSPNGRMPEIESCDGVILLGYHAMAGTGKAVLEHTWSAEEWQNFWINGNHSGEIALDMGLAADLDVPTIMVSGDNKACDEARALVPNIVTAQVKESVSLYGAKLLSMAAAHKLIRAKAAEAVQKCKEIKPIHVAKPVTIRLECVERQANFNAIDKPYMTIIDTRTFEVVGDDMRQAFYRLERM